MEWTKVAKYDFKDIIYEKKGGIARITINRPEALNAFTDVTQQEMVTALDDASHDPAIGVVVLTGTGDKAFSAGMDIKWSASAGLGDIALTPIDIEAAMRDCRKPIIAAVKGYAIGSGNHWAYFCDFTIAADNAIFGQNGPRVGSPAGGYIVSYLTRVVGAKKAREMWMLCRRYTAQEALEMGLVNKVVPLDKLDEEVEKWCQEILALSPTCIQILKASFDADIDYMRGSLTQLLKLMAPDYLDSEESKEAQRAFLEKRQPDFSKFRRPKV